VPRYALTDIRLESVPNALEQARQAAADLCGKPPVKSEVPWFWSDQYDVRLQIVGLPVGVAQRVVRGDPASGKFAVFHLDEQSRLQCVEAVNSPAEFVAARQWAGAAKVLDAARIADTAIAVKEIPAPA
jgi:3-phenylpropionate/trans-cinnamate dioxygenase ferredoxin reductase subunit